MTQALQAHADVGLAAAKAITDRVLEGQHVFVELSAREAAERLAAALETLGAVAAVREVRSGRFELWRQDDNGNRALIRRFDDRPSADAEAARFEALGHRQIYWVEDRAQADE